MLILGIDTATKWTCAAVSGNGKVLAHLERMLGKRQSELLPELVDEALKISGKKISGVDLICTAAGPGYYTGIRAGIAYAAALSKALNKKIVQVSTLKTFVYDLTETDGICVPLLKARGDAVYAAIYKTESGKKDTLLEPCCIDVSELAVRLEKMPEAVLVGADVSLYAPLDALGCKKINREYAPDGQIALIGERCADKAAEPETVRGNYLREPDIGPSKQAN
ncbi:MAG: tRNA (adenosine(37)-N6)-threonylcarbamoyltransferase complex dimerization subunit type 1 TsaB [Synergistaceae bacterium]|nr:tRNA (adenosine(37)-N6)-threonylcarbamoyltransferase complex dimerization subunit type 1 TsaB [Synergistaceae bacterium]